MPTHQRALISLLLPFAFALKAAPGAAKQRGTQMGNPRWEDSIEAARNARNTVSLSAALLMIVQTPR